jgi:erythromycin esterase-like protein
MIGNRLTRRCLAALAAASLALAPSATAQPKLSGTAAAIREAAQPITGGQRDHEDLIAAAGQTSRVLLGESTHGTSEFYRERGRITERLIQDHGFNAIAIEGDCTPTWRVNLYVRGSGTDRNALEALGGYRNFPRWMWGNRDFAAFVERLRTLNLARPPEQRVGIYGMDVYDLFDAADAVVAYLREVDAGAAERVRRHYACFAPFHRSTEQFMRGLQHASARCRDKVEAALAEVSRLPRPIEAQAAERHFAAIRSAASVVAAEDYFRTAALGTMAWNVRDRQMERNVEDIAAHAQAVSGRPGKVVVWSHNSHTGDARATSARYRGEITLGQLMRQRHGERAFLVGFFTHGGSVLAAPDWDEAGRTYRINQPVAGSHAALFHEAALPAFSLKLRGRPDLVRHLSGTRPQRAIGVVYRPETEWQSHYIQARLPEQFDAILFLENSNAVTPLD